MWALHVEAFKRTLSLVSRGQTAISPARRLSIRDYKRLLRNRVWYTSNTRVVFTLHYTVERCWPVCIVFMSPALRLKMELCALCLEPFQTASSRNWISEIIVQKELCHRNWNSERSHFCHMARFVCRMLCEVEWRKSLLMRNLSEEANTLQKSSWASHQIILRNNFQNKYTIMFITDRVIQTTHWRKKISWNCSGKWTAWFDLIQCNSDTLVT